MQPVSQTWLSEVPVSWHKNLMDNEKIANKLLLI